ncbi:MAG: helix-turn-helix domain-containing protein [Candidatus Peregrinibacteria bacterium]
MNPIVSVRNQRCPNSSCALHERSLEGNILIHSRKRPRLKCKSCGKTWAAHRHEIYYGLRTATEKIEKAIALLEQGLSIRQVARRVRASPSSVHRWKLRNKK